MQLSINAAWASRHLAKVLIGLNAQIDSLTRRFDELTGGDQPNCVALMVTLVPEPQDYFMNVENKDRIVQVEVGYLNREDRSEPDGIALLEIIVGAVHRSLAMLPISDADRERLTDGLGE